MVLRIRFNYHRVLVWENQSNLMVARWKATAKLYDEYGRVVMDTDYCVYLEKQEEIPEAKTMLRKMLRKRWNAVNNDANRDGL